MTSREIEEIAKKVVTLARAEASIDWAYMAYVEAVNKKRVEEAARKVFNQLKKKGGR